MNLPIHIGIPAFCEREHLPLTIEALCNQDIKDFQVWVCVNQPASFLQDPGHESATRENRETLIWLKSVAGDLPFPLRVLDAVDEQALAGGVGEARRFLFDTILKQAPEAQVLISLDADTLTDPNYVSSVAEAFKQYPNAAGLAAPVYHPLPEDPRNALHILRYELYIRYFQLSLWRIQSPYAFLAIGSAMAFTPQSYKRVGGMSRKSAGEDFYFMQQLRKTGPVIRWVPAKVYPSSRPSDRVPFGTGPLMMERDLDLQKTRFPFYNQDFFCKLKNSFQALPALFESHIELPIHQFLEERLGGYSAFNKMRRNFSQPHRFVKACHERIDGLRTLQFLRWCEENRGPSPDPETSVNRLLANMNKPPLSLSFTPENIPQLDLARNTLAQYEEECQKTFMDQWDFKAMW